jgi:Tol biopolymer transport system component
VVIDRTGQKMVVSKNWAALGLAWAPSGREIWFTGTRFEKRSDREDQSRLAPPSLRAVSLSGEERSIQHAPDWLVLHDIASDGRVLVSRNTIQVGLSCQAPGESQERDLSWQISSLATGLSADGQTVVFVDGLGGRTSSGNATVFSRNLDGSPAVRLGEGMGGRLSPDKKWVLTQQGDHLVLLPTGAGSPVSLPKGALGRAGMGAWLGDSKRIVFTGYLDNDQPRGYVQEIPNGAPIAITPPNVQLSGRAAVRDEHTILGTSNNEWMLYPLDGGDPRPAFGGPKTGTPIQWSDDGKFVYVTENAAGVGPPSVDVFRVELSTGRRSLWKTLMHSDPIGLERVRNSVFMTPDARSYCYSYMRRLGNLFILDGLK